ncbi:SUKH-4 family immunity protein [Schaalia sp. 19OD2882]|uniref:SUKH-4 family immunity protein n=1 Tax=Schaalia sp. 19OD2882 TaxID=2794089 RepID=UPI001C1EFC8C|nr:SUKH-4 family immunity protein [Schaalia sp. 19OD2882]QWW19537.1 SUKH-4 family immunity protein [Schaalia sp. 19OD2882]
METVDLPLAPEPPSLGGATDLLGMLGEHPQLHHLPEVEVFAPITPARWIADQSALVFARGRVGERLALDAHTGGVVVLVDMDEHPRPVNSSLEAYNACVDALAFGAPYNDDPDSDQDPLTEATLALLRTFEEIDPGCADDDRFWSEIAWDVSMGSWSSDDLTRSRPV